MAEPIPLSRLTEALYTHADVAAMTEILTSSLAELLPPDMVTVHRRRTAADRLAGRPGKPLMLTFDAGGRRLSLSSGPHGRPEAISEHVVRGVRLSQVTIGVDEWIGALAAELARLAADDERARAAIEGFLLG